MSDVGAPDGGQQNAGDQAEEPAAETAYEKGEQELHEAEPKVGDSNAGDQSESAAARSAYQAGEAELHQAEARSDDSNAAEKPEGAEAASAYQAGEAELQQAESEVAWGNAGVQRFTPNYPRPIPPPLQLGLRLNPDIAINVYFTVTIDTVDLGAWSKCTGLGMKIDYEDRKESGMTLFQHHLPGNLTYEQITLERPLTSDCQAVISWFMSYQMLPIPTSGVITCYIQGGTPIMVWEMTGITPVKWDGPTLDATGANNYVTERLTFSHQGFL